MSRDGAVVHWFRRDLRVRDNTSLARAARDGDGVVTVFVLDDHYGSDPNVGPSRFRFLRESLEELAASVGRRGGRLLLRRGPAAEALPALLAEAGAKAVYANAEIGPYPEERDAAVHDALAARGASLRLFQDALLVDPDRVATERGDPYTVYTPFARRWTAEEKAPPLPEPASLAGPHRGLASVPIERVGAWRDLPADPKAPRGGESEAFRLLEQFAAGPIERYPDERNFPARAGTSRLSPHLHFGTISARTLHARAMEESRSASGRTAGRKWISELAWREFYHSVLHHFPRVARESFRRELDGLAWRSDREGLDAWKRGETGYPLVDAAMRELSTTNWMHNRARMVVASFLTKDLHVHWREGERWFEHELADADQANNNGGWQWAAGTGTDAAPYFRIFSPVLQSRRFDPDGAYIRRFLPALARVPDARIHEPWTMSPAEQDAFGCRIGRDYPAPIVDHSAERRVALDLWEAIKKGA
ncbi:MAG TPA: deoxyribodipyrimidine photo-lyase [Thermoanaerobaculia bacterium]|jgi:deoxyribodipyrimidine photo-lyase|nr:deoxyribodipyrimidine photo-lyase [Thermoanaerobaculia bacterium]